MIVVFMRCLIVPALAGRGVWESAASQPASVGAEVVRDIEVQIVCDCILVNAVTGPADRESDEQL
jgi:hypothetical protein